MLLIMADDENYLGYVKYDGELIANGFFDAKKSAEALIGIDEIFRYFIYQISPNIKERNFEFPVRIRKGSWETLIPHTIGEWLMDAGGVGLIAFTKKASEKLAENYIGEKKPKDLVKEAFKSIKWVISISKHLKSFFTPEMYKFKIEVRNGESYIALLDKENVLMFVPYKYFELYAKCPEKLFSKISKYIEDGRELEIGLNPSEPIDSDDVGRSVRITPANKSIFTDEEEGTELLFPELADGQYVELSGHVNKGNETENTIGFQYNGHTLTCFPDISKGNIKNYKHLIFSDCIIGGFIERRNKQGIYDESIKRPKIKFTSLTEIKTQPPKSLFD
jgi:hypothetical protein